MRRDHSNKHAPSSSAFLIDFVYSISIPRTLLIGLGNRAVTTNPFKPVFHHGRNNAKTRISFGCLSLLEQNNIDFKESAGANQQAVRIGGSQTIHAAFLCFQYERQQEKYL